MSVSNGVAPPRPRPRGPLLAPRRLVAPHAIPGDHATPNKARVAGIEWASRARESLREGAMAQ